MKEYWILLHTSKNEKKMQALGRKERVGYSNSVDFSRAVSDHMHQTNSFLFNETAYPPDFVKSVMRMPGIDFAPDYVVCGDIPLCSKKLRDVLDQPEHVVQFLPIDLAAGSDAAHAQDYRRMRVLAHQPAMDVERSGCEVEVLTHRVTGEIFKRHSFVYAVPLRQDLVAKTEMFIVEESCTTVLVTDPLAERVLRAGCTGIEFGDPEANRFMSSYGMYRTASGVEIRR